MSYTLYWRRPSELPPREFAAAVMDCERVLPGLGVRLGGFDGTGHPVFDPDHIVFNGAAPETCEPFEIARIEFDRCGRELASGFCKTQGLPYDFCVKVTLVILSHHLGELLVIGGDGTSDDWTDALQAVWQHLGYRTNLRLSIAG